MSYKFVADSFHTKKLAHFTDNAKVRKIDSGWRCVKCEIAVYTCSLSHFITSRLLGVYTDPSVDFHNTKLTYTAPKFIMTPTAINISNLELTNVELEQRQTCSKAK